jgi:translation initiation factor IF-2
MSVRVYQLAKQLGLDSKDVIQLLRERGLAVSSPSNTIPAIYADALIEEIGDRKLIPKGEKLENSKVADAAKNSEKVPSANQRTGDPGKISNPPTSVRVEAEIVVPPPKVDTGGVVGKGDGRPVSNKIAEGTSVVVSNAANRFAKPYDRGRSTQAIVISANSQDKARKRSDGPDVRLPELPPKAPESRQLDRTEEVVPDQDSSPKFKPFLKKIERQPTKPSNLQPLEIKLPVVVRTLATQMNVKPFQLISKLMSMNIFASMNQEIDITVAQSVAEKFGYSLEVAKAEPEKVIRQKSLIKKTTSAQKNVGNFVERPPIVCVLGHVDHGKTTLLDTIRHTNVVAGEAGGITQHVAAYQIEHGGKKITFIDTPGHAAFSKMRERGANVTDLGILIVAADDGFMPQTDEALKFAKKASIPVVVAINKIDAKGANVDRVKQQMQQRGITPEDWGGEILCAAISALKGTNIENLLELVRLQAEMMELRADISGHPEGVILESRIATGHGVTASAIVQDGTLKIGDCIVCGPCYCKVKSLIDDHGKAIKEAPPSAPVNIVGWSDLPEVGGRFAFIGNERLAREQSANNELEIRNSLATQDDDTNKISNIEQLFSAIAAVEEKFLNVILRADVHGSVEALCDFLGTISSKKIKLSILDCAVGAINKNDVLSANASNAQIVAFNVKIEATAQALAKQLGVKIIQHNIIYEIVDRVREAMAECLDPELHENKLGAVEIRRIFQIKNSTIGGCMVTEGKILRDKFARVARKKEIIFQGKFASIKRQKEDVVEVRAGFECGIMLAGFDAFEVGDVIECFEIQKIQPSL